MSTAAAAAPLAAAAAATSSSAAPDSSASPSAPLALPLPLPPWRLVAVTDDMLPQIALMEEQSYAPDEMCTPDNFRFRLQHAQPFFKAAVAVEPAEAEGGATPAAASARVLGFVVGTLSALSFLDHASMSAHDPAGRYLCVHSVVVAGSLRRRGLARAMLRQYVATVAAEQRGAVAQMALICKAHLIGFYQSCGFALIGPSKVVHGKDQWFECRLQLEGKAEAEAPQL